MDYNTTIGRSALAMLAGALVGGNLSLALLRRLRPPCSRGSVANLAGHAGLLAGGIIIFALIPFVLFHVSNLRQWYAMTALGALTMVSLSLYAFKGLGTGGGLVILATTGGIVGWVIWRVAYRRVGAGMDSGDK